MDSAYSSADYQGGSYRYPGEGAGVMMSRVKETLDHRVWTSGDEYDPEYAQRPIGEIKRMFSQPSVLPPRAPDHASRPKADGKIPSYHPTRRTGWKKPESDFPPLPEPGWMPAILRGGGSHAQSPGPHQMEPTSGVPFPDKHEQSQGRGVPYHNEQQEPRRRSSATGDPGARRHETPVTSYTNQRADRPTMTPFPDRSQRQQAPAGHSYETEPNRHRDTTKPAWTGSLRASGQIKAWEVNAGENIVPGGVDSQDSLQHHAAQSSTYQGRQQHERPRREHKEHRHETRRERQEARQEERQQPFRGEDHQDVYGLAHHEPSHEPPRQPSCDARYGSAQELQREPQYKQSLQSPRQAHKPDEYNPYTNLQSPRACDREAARPYQEAPQHREVSVEANVQQPAKVSGTQYNNPGGLYARSTGAMQQGIPQQRGPSSGRTGHVISTGLDGKKYFNPSESGVYQLLKEEESMKKQRAQQHSARHQEQNPGHEMAYQGYADPMQKSPTMLALEQYIKNESTDF